MPVSIRDVALIIVGQICVGHYHVDGRSVSAAVMSSEMHCFSIHRHREDSLGNEMQYKQVGAPDCSDSSCRSTSLVPLVESV